MAPTEGRITKTE